MKKLMLLIVSLLLCTTAFAQNEVEGGDYIQVSNITTRSFDFSINLTGTYRYRPVTEAELGVYGGATSYLDLFGLTAYSAATYTWEDGAYIEGGTMRISVTPDCDYRILAANCDGEGNIIGPVYYVVFRTPALPTSDAKIDVKFSEITSTTVKIATTPDSSISQYFVYVRDQYWYDEMYDQYGESMVKRLITYENNLETWRLSSSNEGVWTGLTPKTDYYIGIVGIDQNGGESLQLVEFQTTEAVGGAAELEVELNPHELKGSNTMQIRIKSENAAQIYYAFNTTSEVEEQRRKGYDDAYIAKDFGLQLNAEELADAATSSGYVYYMENLWRDTEYTCLVVALTEEKVETQETVVCMTEPEPVPTRVESDLFTSLHGDWEISYEFIDYEQQPQKIEGAVVKIRPGVDRLTNEEYRDLNRMVVLDYPFQSDWETNPINTIYPDELVDARRIWQDDPSLAYRDYGPKFFLEIGEGDVITIPTAQNYNFYGWYQYNLQFYGCDYDASITAPATFPVELSEDGNTLTIKACESGQEFGYGVYRPAVFISFPEGDALRNVATTDIVLKRISNSVKDAVAAQLQVEPNAVQSTLNITGFDASQSANVAIYNVAGQQVMSINNWSGDSIDVSALAAGIYFVNINSTTIKFIKL